MNVLSAPSAAKGGLPGGDVLTSVAILMPPGDATARALRGPQQDSIASIEASSLDHLADLVDNRIGAVLITEEALWGVGFDRLKQALAAQPLWSDVPFIVLADGTTGDRSEAASERTDDLGNAVLLPRLLRAEELLRSVRFALKARGRQHEARVRMEELQNRDRQVTESEAQFQAIANSVDQMIWSTTPDGFHDYYNKRWYEFTGVPEGSTDGEAWNGMFHPDDQERAWKIWRHSLNTGEPYEIEYRLRHCSGRYHWVLGRALPVRSADGTILRWYGTCTDIHEIKIAEEQRQLMLAEMNHRVKNTLAMVHSVVSQTLRHASNLDDARAAIQSRIGSMSQAHDRLIHSSWLEARIGDIVDTAIAPHRAEVNRFIVEGPNLLIGSKQALALTMALHELATNAAKYGALSGEEGKVRIGWSVGGEDEVFHFIWVEEGGPEVREPSSRGFGSKMIEKALAGYFRGAADLAYDPGGLRFQMTAPLEGLTS
ncbi:sensor histidine kinase [Limimaricola sp. AA108-03]|uniref:sensor histidine kinase n=1 Tax=Limimaricola sp. AA108-03 TaxID=3425945 RepID=UPI003D77B683